MSNSLIIRCDGSSEIGVGHVMRSLALAQTWQEAGGNVIFVMGMRAPVLETRLRSEGMEVINIIARPGKADDAEQTSKVALKKGAKWIVVDGYHFGTDYQEKIKAAGFQLLFIDDNGHAAHYFADVVLNQNIYANENLYPHRESHTTLLLGPSYALLRREFWKWRGWKREFVDLHRKVLVTIGGGDPDNMTLKVINAFQMTEIPDLKVKIVVGPLNPHIELLNSAVNTSPCTMQILSSVTNMPELMAWADVAVSAGGSTCWELAFMGLPAVILTLAENQQRAVKMITEQGIAIGMAGEAIDDIDCIAAAADKLLRSAKTCSIMSLKGSNLFDGFGGMRVMESLS